MSKPLILHRLYPGQIKISPFSEFTAPEGASFGLYANRSVAHSWGECPETSYWQLRQKAILFDTPENPIEVKGPDAQELLNKVLTRDISTLPVGRAVYGIACCEDGGILMDGVLIRREEELYWYVTANGDFFNWLRAHAVGMRVTVSEPETQVLQVQGPFSMQVLDSACDGGAPDPFPYFGAAQVTMGGQPLMITRTGWSGELGWEFYTNEQTDNYAIWEHILNAGKKYGLAGAGMEGLSIRRVEAGLFNNTEDLDPNINPFQASLGSFVNMEKEDFIGKSALESAEREQLLWGVTCDCIDPAKGAKVHYEDQEVGFMTTGCWSPFLRKGIGFVRFNIANQWEGKRISVPDTTGKLNDAIVVQLPFYDAEKRIPRGLDVSIPVRTK